MRLVSWYVDGFRNLRNVTINVSNGVILAGENNSGKSNLIRSLLDYKSLFSGVEQQTPRSAYNRLPLIQDEYESDPESERETSPEVGRTPYEDWIDSRVSGGSNITFRATFEPDPPVAADSFEELSEELQEFATNVIQKRSSRKTFRDTVCDADWFNKFIHHLVVSESGIEEEYFATDIERDQIVIAGRTTGNSISHVIYPMLHIGNDEVPRQELQLDSLTPDRLEALTASDEEADEDSIWFRPAVEGDNTHGGVIHSGLYQAIQDDISAWDHVPAVRVPAVAELTGQPGPADTTGQQGEFERLLRYIKYDLENYRDYIYESYTSILSDPEDFEIDWFTEETGVEGTALMGRQSESHGDDSFYSLEMSTGSLQVLCILAAIVDHVRNSETIGSILAIEEPETHLNPRTQRKVHQFLLQEIDNGVAPVITSHSPTIIDNVQFGRRYVVLKEEYSEVEEFEKDFLELIRVVGVAELSSYLEANSLVAVPTRRWKVMLEAIASKRPQNLIKNGVFPVVCETDTELALMAHVAGRLNLEMCCLPPRDDPFPDTPLMESLEPTERAEILNIGGSESIASPEKTLQTHIDSIEEFDSEVRSSLPDPDEVTVNEWIAELEEICEQDSTHSIEWMLYKISEEVLSESDQWGAVLDSLEEKNHRPFT